jgi:O-antigen/teichoic acid export membrane protein
VIQAETDSESVWGQKDGQLFLLARNVASRYLAIGIDAVMGFIILPFNVHHLGQSAYGLWMLMSSLTMYFSVLDLGFGSAVTKFVAQYRAKRDARSLNEIVSTIFFVFTGIGALAYVGFVVVALFVGRLFRLQPEQIETARHLTLIIGVYVAATFPFSVFGGIINGFQRYDVNSIVGIGSSILVAIVNVVMLLSGFSLVSVVMATTTVRLATFLLYRWNAYQIFPRLVVRPSLFRWDRVRELSTFSVYISMIDWAGKINYSADALVIGAFMPSAAVAIWTVPQRLAEGVQRLTNQINGVLFPVVVDSDAGEQPDRLRVVFLQATRFTLVLVVPVVTALLLLAGPLIRAWVGPSFETAIPVAQLLLLVVAVRVGNSSATTVLKGAGCHRFLAFTNLSIALGNVALSLLLIRNYGLIGQAIGTLIPVAVGSAFVLWPATCRRVGVGPMAAFTQAVWPTLWPLVPMAAVVLPLRYAMPERLYAVALAAATGAVCYIAVYLAFSVKQHERDLYLGKLVELARRRRSVNGHRPPVRQPVPTVE